MGTIIEVQNISKKYGNYTAVEGISFEATEGQILGLLGPNGAGKTTTMRIVTGFIPSTTGTVIIDGYDVFYDSMKIREKIGYLPETPPLYPEMTVYSYLKFVARIKQVSEKNINTSTDIAIELCNLEDVKNRTIGNLSKGFKQRVGLAQSIIHNPKVLILDEATVGLDPNQVITTREMIKKIAFNKTVIFSTHILSEVEYLCSEVVIMNKGKIVGQGKWQDMQETLQEKLIIKIRFVNLNDDVTNKIASFDIVDSVQTQDTNYLKVVCQKNENNKTALIKLITDNNIAFDEITTEKMNLEDVFKNLTTNRD